MRSQSGRPLPLLLSAPPVPCPRRHPPSAGPPLRLRLPQPELHARPEAQLPGAPRRQSPWLQLALLPPSPSPSGPATMLRCCWPRGGWHSRRGRRRRRERRGAGRGKSSRGQAQALRLRRAQSQVREGVQVGCVCSLQVALTFFKSALLAVQILAIVQDLTERVPPSPRLTTIRLSRRPLLQAWWSARQPRQRRRARLSPGW